MLCRNAAQHRCNYKMKIVHTADWHIGKVLNDYSLLEDQQFWFDRFIERLSEIRPDALVIAGDLYDRSIPSGEAVCLMNSILCRIVLDLKIETFLIAGNHDSRERLSFGSELLERSGLHIAGRITGEISPISLDSDAGKVNFYLLPYLEPHNVKSLFPEETIKTHDEAIRAYTVSMLEKVNPEEINILAAHGLFSCWDENAAGESAEISVGGSEMVNASPFGNFDYVALGHLHSFRNAGDSRMIYSGSPLKYSIDEANQKKGFCVVDLPRKGELSLSFETISPLRDVRILEGSFEWLSQRENHSGLEDYVFVNITDKTVVLNAISRLKAVFPNILGLRYVNLESAAADSLNRSRNVLRRLTNLELFEEFYQTVTRESLTPEQTACAEAAFSDSEAGDDTKEAEE